MRTRDEQIEDACQQLENAKGHANVVNWMRGHIIEAERRAEQRVRAEIGRDSERLDYLGTLGQCCVEYDSLGEWTVWKHTGPSTDPINMGESVCSIRSAIDAARGTK